MSELHRAWGGVVVAVGLLALVPVAGADDAASTGGAAVPDEPEVDRVACDLPGTPTGGQWACPRGATAVIEGESLEAVRRVRFLGGRGRTDDRVARPSERDEQRLTVRVPTSARSGPIAVESSAGRARTAQRLQVLDRAEATTAPTPAGGLPASAPPGSEVFPIRGAHSYGTETNTFGGGRGHQGQDVFAECGTPLVAIADATVQYEATQSRAGHYVVLQRADGESYAYMHLQAPATVDRGDTVRAGQQIGRVGDTGRASGCHLHFEQWTAPGWYEGGRPIDPLPLLRRLDR